MYRAIHKNANTFKNSERLN